MNSHLIEIKDLIPLLGNTGLKVLRVQMAPIGGQIAPPATKFIPGARNFDIDDLSDESSSLPHTALGPEAFAMRIRELGIDSEDEIVVYDDHGIYSSPRAWFLFLNAGHSKIRVLNGGLPAWIDAGIATMSTSAPVPKPGNFTARPSLRTFVHRSEVEKVVNCGGACLWDARSAERYFGLIEEPRAGLRRGHIPTARSIPFTSVLDGTRMKRQEDLTRTFDSVNQMQLPVIAYCGSGVTACIVALALEVAGGAPARIYDGSWSEWGHFSAPIEFK